MYPNVLLSRYKITSAIMLNMNLLVGVYIVTIFMYVLRPGISGVNCMRWCID